MTRIAIVFSLACGLAACTSDDSSTGAGTGGNTTGSPDAAATGVSDAVSDASSTGGTADSGTTTAGTDDVGTTAGGGDGGGTTGDDAVLAGDNGGTTGGGDTATTTTSTSITASAGGSVTTPGDTATLTIPAGALSADTVITAAELPATGDALVPIVELGPEGLTFDPPATLSFTFDGTVPTGKKVVVAVQGSSGFEAIAASVEDGGVVSAPVAHFSKYTLIFVADGGVIAGTCPTVTACGGDIVGTWDLQDLCFVDQGQPPPVPPEWCPEASGSIEQIWEGTVVFTASDITTTFAGITTQTTIIYPLACMTAAGTTCAEALDGSCTVVGTDCVCSGSDTMPGGTFSQGITVDTAAGTFTMADGSTGTYCVTGDVLQTHTVSVEGSETVGTAKRQAP